MCGGCAGGGVLWARHHHISQHVLLLPLHECDADMCEAHHTTDGTPCTTTAYSSLPCPLPLPPPPYPSRCTARADCPFLANCVGQGNLRAFLLVLLWVLLAAAYILCMCGLLVWQHWDKVRASVGAGANTTTTSSSSSTSSISSTSMQPPQVWDVNPAGRVASAGDAVPVSSVGSTNSSIPPGVTRVTAVEEAGSDLWLYATTGILILVLQGSPGWLLIAYYLMAISLGLLIGVGMLFGSQLHYLGLGVSYIDHLKAAHGGQNLSPSRQYGLEQQQQQQQSGCWHRMQLTWVQWWVVMGCASPGTAWSMLQAIMTPMWKAPATATKKWS